MRRPFLCPKQKKLLVSFLHENSVEFLKGSNSFVRGQKNNLEPSLSRFSSLTVEKWTMVGPDHLTSKTTIPQGSLVLLNKNTLSGDGRELHCTRAVSWKNCGPAIFAYILFQLSSNNVVFLRLSQHSFESDRNRLWQSEPRSPYIIGGRRGGGQLVLYVRIPSVLCL